MMEFDNWQPFFDQEMSEPFAELMGRKVDRVERLNTFLCHTEVDGTMVIEVPSNRIVSVDTQDGTTTITIKMR